MLGILVMNIQSFSMPETAYMNPATYGDLTGWNYAVWFVSHVLFNGKFYGLFSMMFGAGILLMAERRERVGESAVGIHYRRMATLLVIGIAHAHLIWEGDILYFYAICGMIVFLVRRLPPRWLVVIGIALLGITSGISELAYAALESQDPREREATVAMWFGDESDVEAELEAYRGGWLDQMPQRSRAALGFEIEGLLYYIGASSAGFMLIGMALFKRDALHARWSSRRYAMLIVVAVFVGVPLILLGVRRMEESAWDSAYVILRGAQYNYWAAPLASLGWMGVVMLLYKHRIALWLIGRLADVGKMALTNYLMQSVICTAIFYGHGLGMFGKVDRTGQLGVVLGVWLFQLIASPLWMTRFRFGPAEWAWRWVTYGNRPVMIRARRT